MLSKTPFKKIIIVAFASIFLALLSSSYFETAQTNFFASIKHYIEHGSFSKLDTVEDNGSMYTFHRGQRYLNPVNIFQQVLGHSEAFMSKKYGLEIKQYSFFDSNGDFDRVLQIADFMKSHFFIEEIGGLQIVRYPYEIDYAPFKAPWYSGMAQGHAAIVFLHAYTITGNQDYLQYARLSINMLSLPFEKGGVMLELESGSGDIWFEEYADPTMALALTPRVLNGNIFAIDGLFWLWFVTKDAHYLDLLKGAINGINSVIDQLDTGLWSYYGFCKNFASSGYHLIHIEQLRRMIEYSKIIGLKYPDNIEKYKKRFQIYRAFPFMGYGQRMLFQRNNMIYVIFVSNYLFSVFLTNILWRIVLLKPSRPIEQVALC
ncbi:MAG: D-glucuronyl C5-epimerase family protein [Tenuifilaceae bacterium]|nr:D-glucuronyl C5-epimerase family protein [Tenuifilaceae bacterium]